MQKFEIARNEKTSVYEVHAAGCKHTMARHLEVTSTTTAATGADAAAEFEAGNEGCYTKLGPCAKGAGPAVVEPPAPCGYCRRCAVHDDPGGCLTVQAWEHANPEAAIAAIQRAGEAFGQYRVDELREIVRIRATLDAHPAFAALSPEARQVVAVNAALSGAIDALVGPVDRQRGLGSGDLPGLDSAEIAD